MALDSNLLKIFSVTEGQTTQAHTVSLNGWYKELVWQLFESHFYRSWGIIYLLPCLKMLSCEGTSRYVLKRTTLKIWRLSSKIIFLSFQSTKILVVKWIIAAFISRISKFQFLKDFITYRNSCSLYNTKMKSKYFKSMLSAQIKEISLGKKYRIHHRFCKNMFVYCILYVCIIHSLHSFSFPTSKDSD